MAGISSVIAGLVGSGQGESTIDMKALLETIANSGQYQRSIINALPPQIQANLAKYAESLKGAGADYQKNIEGLGTDYMSKIQGLYGPDSAAATATKSADLKDIYSSVPGAQNAIRNAMAATGGLSRGQAGVQLAQPYVQAAQQYGRTASGVNAAQASAGQGAMQQALSAVTSMDASMFQQTFGMSKEQATMILQSGNQALQQQLADLINQSNTETSQKLSVQGIQAQNAYQNALQQKANQNAVWTGLGNMGVEGASMMFNPSTFAAGGPGAAASSGGFPLAEESMMAVA